MAPLFLFLFLSMPAHKIVGGSMQLQSLQSGATVALAAKLSESGVPVQPQSDADSSDTNAGRRSHNLDSESSHTSDFSITVGLPVTPNRKATDTDTGGIVWNQESRIGPSAGLTFRKWLGSHSGLFAEVGYSNTNTRLANYDVNTWTMNRVTVDGGYTYRWTFNRFTPYVKVGCGAMILISGMALNDTSAGLDDRMEGLAGSGIDYRLNVRLSLKLEYEGRLIRNSDFSDITWRPQRNWISEPKLGITYTFGRSR